MWMPSRACYAPREHAMRLAGMLSTSRACYAPCVYVMRLAGMLCASRACYAPRGDAIRLAGMLCASLTQLARGTGYLLDHNDNNEAISMRWGT